MLEVLQRCSHAGEVYMSRVIHFDLFAKDVDRAIEFYRNAFGWTIEKWAGPTEYWLIGTGDHSTEGIDGGLGPGEPSLKNSELTLGVDSIDAALKLVTEAGGTVDREKMPVPGVGWMATVVDTEGNVFGLMQLDPEAE